MASRDQDKPAAKLLRRGLAQSSSAADACPDPEILAAYFERSLDAEELARYELHLSECGSCREQIAAMARVEESSPDAQPRQTWSWLWDWRRLVPALAALVIIAAIWRVERPVQPPLVAMSRQSESPAMTAAPESLRASDAPAPIAAPAPAPPPAANTIGRLEPSTATARALQESEVSSESKTASANPPTSNGGYAQTNASAEPVKEPAPAPIATDMAENAPISGGTLAPARLTTGAAPGGAAAAPQPESNSDKKDLSLPSAPAPKPMLSLNKSMAAGALSSRASGQGGTAAADAMGGAGRPLQSVIRTPDPRISWRIAEGGFVERSIDGGATWQGQLPNLDAHYLAGAAPGPKICWLVGSGGIILLTTDAVNWKSIPPPATVDFVAITAKDASSATITAADSRKFATTDGGKHWTSTP